MRALLCLAALAVIAPVSTIEAQTASFGAKDAIPWVASLPHEGRHVGDGHHGGQRDVHVHRGIPAGYPGFGYAAYNESSDFDGNRSFDPEKWNDWWHDRPDRAYPRWLSRNQDCARPWYRGDVLTC